MFGALAFGQWAINLLAILIALVSLVIHLEPSFNLLRLVAGGLPYMGCSWSLAFGCV